MKKRVHKLVVSGSNTYRLLGISSHENDYRLSWALNRKLGLKLQKTDGIPGNSRNNTENMEFSVFQSVQEDILLKLNLISNRCPDGFLVTEMKNIDFFLQIFGEASQSQIDNISKKLKSIDIVSAVFEIKPAKLKNYDNFPPE